MPVGCEKNMRQNKLSDNVFRFLPIRDAFYKPLISRAFCHISQMRPIIDLGKPTQYGPRGLEGAGRGFSTSAAWMTMHAREAKTDPTRLR